MKTVRVKNFFWLHISRVCSLLKSRSGHQKQLQTQSLQKSKYSTESTDGGRKEETRRENRDNKKKEERESGMKDKESGRTCDKNKKKERG